MAVVYQLEHIENCNCGIYCIVNPKDKIYVGSSKNIKTRFYRYNKLECVNQHKLYNSFMKYGLENHKFIVLKETTFEELHKYEREIGLYFNVVEDGLNIQLPSDGSLPWIMDVKAREKIRDSKLGKKRPEEIGKRHSEYLISLHLPSHKRRKILCYCVENNNFICEYSSATEAGELLNIGRTNINNNLCNRSKIVNSELGKIYFKYKEVIV